MYKRVDYINWRTITYRWTVRSIVSAQESVNKKSQKTAELGQPYAMAWTSSHWKECIVKFPPRQTKMTSYFCGNRLINVHLSCCPYAFPKCWYWERGPSSRKQWMQIDDGVEKIFAVWKEKAAFLLVIAGFHSETSFCQPFLSKRVNIKTRCIEWLAEIMQFDIFFKVPWKMQLLNCQTKKMVKRWISRTARHCHLRRFHVW